MRISVATLAGLILASFLAAPGAQGQAQTHDLVESEQDWSVFQAGEGDDKVCWIASQPTNWRALRGGDPVEVRRGDIYLMISFRPGDDVQEEVSFVAGYPLQEGSTVEAEVGGEEWEMFTSDDSAWLPSPEQDAEVVAAFKRGADATVTGVSARGTTTIDTFSLMGFTNALERAAELCS